jgi:hypothetical protein
MVLAVASPVTFVGVQDRRLQPTKIPSVVRQIHSR